MFAFLRSKSQPTSPRAESDEESKKTATNEEDKQPTIKAEEPNQTSTNAEEKQPTIEPEESNKTATNDEEEQPTSVEPEESNKTDTNVEKEQPTSVEAKESNETATNEEEKQPTVEAEEPNKTPTANETVNDLKNDGGLESQPKQKVEQYAVQKAEETTITVNDCLRMAEDIKGDATRTLESFHDQGEQAHKTHETAATPDKDLKKGEKLLDSLGGIFSKSWKAMKTGDLEGLLSPDSSPKSADKEDKQKLMADPEQKGKQSMKMTAAEPANSYEKIEMEKAKQDDALEDLNNILGDLKGMAADMGSELERQSHALNNIGEDIDELNSRVEGANERARKLVAN